MTEDRLDAPLLKMAVFMGLLDRAQGERILAEKAHWKKKGRQVSVAQLLVKRGFLEPGQVRQLVLYLQRGYRFCPPCRRVFPSGGPKNCTQCGQGLRSQKGLATEEEIATVVDTFVDEGAPPPPSSRHMTASDSERITPPAGEGETQVDSPHIDSLEGGETLAEDPSRPGQPLVEDTVAEDPTPYQPEGPAPSSRDETPDQNSDGATVVDPDAKARTGQPGASPSKSFLPSPPPELSVSGTLGEGGWGTVYQVKDPLSGRSMALKVLKAQEASDEKKARFLREIDFLSHLQHPHIMPLYRSGYLDDGGQTPFYIMKEIRGGTLKDRLEALDHESWAGELDGLLGIFTKVLEAVDFAHSLEVIHRDLKPENIAVGDYGEVLVMDWGVATLKGEKKENEKKGTGKKGEAKDGENLTRDGAIVGTPGYLSPEQARGKKADERSDIFSLGAILYEILTGKIPIPGPREARTVNTLMKDPDPPQKAAPERKIPPELAAMALKALSRAKHLRYQSAAEFRNDLERYRRGYSVTALQEGWAKRGWKWIKRNPLLSGSLALAALLLLSVTGGTIWWSDFQRRNRADQYFRQARETLEGDLDSLKASGKKRGGGPAYHLDLKEAPDKIKERKRKIARLFESRRKLNKALQLAPERKEIKKWLWRTEREIGRLALEGRNYLLSRTSFQRGKRLGYGDESRELLDRLKEARRKVRKERLKKVRAIMAGLAKSPPKEGMKDEYITQILRIKSPYITRELAKYIDSEKKWPRLVAIEALGKLRDNETKYKGQVAGWHLMERLKSLDLPEEKEEAKALIWALGRLREGRAILVVYRIRDKMGLLFRRKTTLPFQWIPSPHQQDDKGPRTWAERGKILLEKEDYQGAVRALSRAIEKGRETVLIYRYRGTAYKHLKKYRLAIEDFNRGIELSYLFALPLKEKKKLDQKECSSSLRKVFANRGISLSRRPVVKVLKKGETWTLSSGKSVQTSKEKITIKATTNLRHWLIKRNGKNLKVFDLSPRVSSLYNNRGIAHKELGNSFEALRDYHIVIAMNPRDRSSHNNRALIYKNLGKWKKALKDFNRAIKSDPKAFITYINRSTVYREQGEMEKALADCNRAIEINSKHPPAYLGRGQVYVEQSKYKKALRDFSKAIHLAPRNADAYIYRAGAYAKIGEKKKARKDYSQALKLNPNSVTALCNYGRFCNDHGWHKKAYKLFSRAIEVDPKEVVAYRGRGRSLLSQNKPKKALPDFNRALALAPQDLENQHVVYSHRCYVYHLLGEYKKAIVDSNRALKLNPNTESAYVIRGQAWSQLGNKEKALRDYNLAVKHGYKSADIFYLRGMIYFSKDRDKLAYRDATRALKINDHHKGALYLRSMACLVLKKYKEAYRDCHRWVKVDPQNPLSYYHRARACIGLGKLEKALQDLDILVQKNTFLQAAAYAGRAEIYLKQGLYQKALENCNQAIKIDKKSSPPYKHRAMVYVELGKEKMALIDFNQALKLNPKYAEAFRERGKLHRQLGHGKKARADFEKYLKLSPKAPDRKEIEQYLKDG